MSAWKKHLAARVRELLAARRMSQQEVSVRGGWNRRTLASFLANDKPPRVDTLQRIADGIGVRLVVEFVPKDQTVLIVPKTHPAAKLCRIIPATKEIEEVDCND